MVQLVLDSTVRGQTWINSEVVSRVAQSLEGGVHVDEGRVVWEQVRRVRESTEQLQKEGKRWRGRKWLGLEYSLH